MPRDKNGSMVGLWFSVSIESNQSPGYEGCSIPCDDEISANEIASRYLKQFQSRGYLKSTCLITKLFSHDDRVEELSSFKFIPKSEHGVEQLFLFEF